MKILIVVDAQNDFVTGSLGSPEAEKVVPNIVKKINNYNDNDFIVCTLDTHFDNYLETQEGRNLPVKHCIKETKGHHIHNEIVDALIPRMDWTTPLQKSTFGSTFLPNLIDNHMIGNHMIGKEIEEIELVGYVLDICVISNALLLKAHFPETKISVDVSCCAATSPEAFEAAKVILKSCQVEVKGEQNKENKESK